MAKIEQRKKDHVDLTINEETQYLKSAGFERFEFVHNALPEIDYDEVNTNAKLLERTFSFPLFISSMTGGYDYAETVNSVIAEFCEEHNIPFGVGSQRVMIDNPSMIKTFSIVREKAPKAFICANIGGAQLIGGFSQKNTRLLIDSIDANAIIVHLNPLQELMQPEGDRNFKGVLDGIEQLVTKSNIPIIVKETGAGISAYTAKRLLNVGVSVIDVAGAGGTSWSKVENSRKKESESLNFFNEWGISTVNCLLDLSNLQWERSFEVISSGGIRSSSDMVKSLCLGANFCATAQPIIKTVILEGREGLNSLFEAWQHQLKVILTLLGCTNISELSKTHLKDKSTL